MQIAVHKWPMVAGRLRLRWVEGLSYTLIAPAALYVFALVGVPFVTALYLSVSSATLGDQVGRFVGLGNFISMLHNQTFRQALGNSFVFTFGGEVVKIALGFTLALVLLETLPAKKLRASSSCFRGRSQLCWVCSAGSSSSTLS